MRYWYDSDNLSWTSNDGYQIWLDSNIYGYKLFSPDGFCLGVWFCDDLRKQIGDLDIKLYTYMFYKAERFLTSLDIKIEELLDKTVGTITYYDLDQLPDPECTVKFKDNKCTCGNCTHLIFKNYKNCSGTCFYTHMIKSFYNRCDHEEEMS